MRITENSFGIPVITPETKAFWDAVNNEKLLFAYCQACGKSHAYPRRICPFCLSQNVVWKASSGGGQLYAFSLYRKGRPPYVSAWVMLKENVALLTNIIDCDTEKLEIGMNVGVKFVNVSSEQSVPVFAPK